MNGNHCICPNAHAHLQRSNCCECVAVLQTPHQTEWLVTGDGGVNFSWMCGNECLYLVTCVVCGLANGMPARHAIRPARTKHTCCNATFWLMSAPWMGMVSSIFTSCIVPVKIWVSNNAAQQSPLVNPVEEEEELPKRPPWKGSQLPDQHHHPKHASTTPLHFFSNEETGQPQH